MARVCIKNIAEQLGVSNATVSLVLNGKEKDGRVGTELAEKIRATARALKYEPNNLARSLRIGRSQTIGVIVADISNHFFANLAFHIQEQAEKFGYSVIITNSNESDLKMEKMVNILKNRQVDGFIIVPTENGEAHVVDLVKCNIPVVLLDRYFPALNINVSAVAVDNCNASKDAVKNLIKQGCKNIGLVIYKSSLHHMLERKRGYVEVLQEHNIYNPALIKEVNYSLIASDSEIAMESLLSKENKVDGIFFATNTLSMLGIKYVMNLHIEIPNHLKVVCFDKSEAFDFTPIPYILQPVPEMGRKVVELLMEHIKGKTTEANYVGSKYIELPTRLINGF